MAAGQNPFKSSAELDAFLSVHQGRKDRLAATVWLFENQSGNFVVCESDVALPSECLPAANVWKYSWSPADEEKPIEFASVHKKEVGRFLQHLLLVKHFRVEVFKSDGGGKKPSFERSVKASPCDLGEIKHLLFGEESQAEYAQLLKMGPVCCILMEGDVKEPKLGVTFWFDATKKAKVAQFYDNTNMDILESMLIQHTPMECVVPATPKYRQVKTVLERNRVLVSPFSPKKADVEKAEADVSEGLPHDAKGFFGSNRLSLRSLARMKLHSGASAESIFSKPLEVLSAQEFVLFNAQADAGLNIFDPGDGGGGGGGGGGFSLLKILSRTRTSGGDRMLRVWLRQPLTDREKICERLDTVEQLVEASVVRKSLHDENLRRIPDFESISLKIVDGKAKLVDLYKAYVGIREVRKIVEVVSGQEGLLEENFRLPLEKKALQLDKFLEMVETTLDFDALNDNKYVVNPNFDNELQELKAKMDGAKEGMERCLSKVAAALGLEEKKSVKLENSSQHGYCFRVTMKDEKALRKKGGIFVVDTTKAGVRFRNFELERLNGKFAELSCSYEEQQQYVVREILGIASGYTGFVSELGSLLSRLDCLVSFAVAADQAPIPYAKPEVLPRDRCSELSLEEARHPCLETVDGVAYIPNSARFRRDDRGFCVITGPNLGGKSTYLRSVALNVLMAQVGSFVACRSARMFPVDRILVRIGAGDSQLAGVSTFMAEMLEASHIVRSATRHSLVLIDELGRGTSTYDGLGLAWAISKHIASEIRAFALFATHFHEVTKLSDEIPTVFNCHVDALASDDEFTLLYNVKPGSSNKSFGIEVAKLAGFPDEVVADARRYLLEAEMPLLRSSGSIDAGEVEAFLKEWKDDRADKKRKAELLEGMRAKVAKTAA